MDENTLKLICSHIYDEYKWCEGVIPQIFSKPNNTYLLIFETIAKTDDNQQLPLILRVTVDNKGKILKTSTSR